MLTYSLGELSWRSIQCEYGRPGGNTRIQKVIIVKTTNSKSPSVKLLFDGASGQYIPKRFAKEIDRKAISGVKTEDLDYLAIGPGGCLDDDDSLTDGESVRGEYYWDTWQTVLDNAILTDTDGNKYRLEQNDDVWLIPIDWEYCEEKDCWRQPESDTLRRYELPVYWASYIANGDDSGIEESDRNACDEFMESEGLTDWTFSEVGESYFSHSNDATNIGGDVAEFEFVKIG